jgi:hypothetical protein
MIVALGHTDSSPGKKRIKWREYENVALQRAINKLIYGLLQVVLRPNG